MTNKCLVCGYRSRAGEGLSFHRFPDNIQRRQQWLNALNLEHANKWHYVCGKHFQPYDYEEKKSGQRILKRDAVPVSHEFGPIQEELSGTVEEEVVLMTEPSTSKDQVIESIVALPFTRTISQTTISSERTITASDSESCTLTASESCTLTASEVADGSFVETDEVNEFKIPESRKRKNESSTSSPSSSKSSSSPNRGSISDSTLPPTKSDSTRVPLTKRRKIVRKSYFGDINSEDLASPSKARKAFGIARKTISTYRRKMHSLQQQNRRRKARVMNLKSLLDHLLHKKLLSNSALESIEASLPVPVADIVKRILKGSKSEQYSPSLRAFALTLHFYSPRAYNYVRETFNKSLPHPSTVSKWYQNINGSPGFTTESLAAIKDRVEQNKLKGKATYANLVMDEMSIRKKVEWVENRFIGFVDFGSDVDSDSLPEAKEVLVFLITSVNGCWKIPVGYFCIDGLSGTERSNLVKNCLRFLHESGVIITSLTFDGAASNIAMAKQLGADFSDVNNLKTYFDHPVTKHKIFIFLDICHMMKLVRNCLGDFKILKTTNNKTINWHYLDELVNLQTTEGLSAAPKIKRRHMQYAKEKMRVKIATQTFSKSVHDALIFLEHDLGLNNFRGAEYTANFCLIFNDVFDILNSRSKFAAYIFKRGFSSETETLFLQKFKEMKESILSLTLRDVPVITSSRKTGFIGFLVGMESFNGIYETYVKSGELNFLLGYKFSQDHLETFFSCVRSMHGFNNNPSCRQFQSAYKKLLVSKEVRGADTGNAINLDNTLILHVSSRKITINDDKEDIQASAEYKKLCEDLDNHDFFSSTDRSEGGSEHSNPYWEQAFSQPYFDNTTRREVTTTVGQTAHLHCRVGHLGDRAVSWIRKRDLHILTVGILTYTNDQRFQSLHTDGSNEWTLKVTSPQVRDSGIYECQVSTEPKISQAFKLNVVVSKAKIMGNPELYIKSGSDINLTCIVLQTPDPPSFIYWYRGGNVINYSQRGGINVVTEKQTRTSRLLISKALPQDSGNYTCSPSSSDAASVLVHVLHGEQPAAMQHGNSSSTATFWTFNIMLFVLLQIALLER